MAGQPPRTAEPVSRGPRDRRPPCGIGIDQAESQDPGSRVTGRAPVPETTLPPSPEVMRRWRSGPRWFFAVAAMIDDEQVEQRRRQVLGALGPWVRPSAPGQAHVTLAALGFGAHPSGGIGAPGRGRAGSSQPPTTAPAPRRPDPAAIGVQELPALRLRIRGAELFASAAYLTVDALDDGLARARARHGEHDLERSEPWVPHVTVGVFTQAVPIDDVRRRLAPLSVLPPLDVTARARLMAVDARSALGALTPAASVLDHHPVSEAATGSRTLHRGGFA